MRDRYTSKKIIVVTTSWDDGHPLDLRLADLLCEYGLSGTFYVPLKYKGYDVINSKDIKRMRKIGMEIGSHTLTHPVLTKLPQQLVFKELIESKKLLEDILGEPVSSFCYTKGRFNRKVASQVIEAGYTLARTTVSFRTKNNFNPFYMPVSFQFFPHTTAAHVRHALKEANLNGIMNWLRFLNMETDLTKLSGLLFDHILQNGGIFHVWGHSWEIEKFALWNSLEEIFKRISKRHGVQYLTNSQTLEWINQ